ncbi:hypothetical protein MY11210_002422 [Beauveria gryllotalpidicola]
MFLKGYTVVCFLADVGQDEDYEAVEKKALALGAERMIIDNLQQEFVDDESSNLYSETEASMDLLEGFSPEATSGFLTIQAIRLEKYGAAKIKAGEPLVGPQ